YWNFARVIPEGRPGGHFDFRFTSAIPVNRQPLPAGFAVFKSRCQRRQSAAFETGATLLGLAGLVGGGKQRGIQTQGHNQGHVQAPTPSQQLQNRVRTIGDKNQDPFGRPAFDLEDNLLGPVRQVLGLASARLIIAGRRSQDRQKRKGPNSAGPRYVGQQLHTEPAQAAGFIEDALAGAGPITVNAAGGDASAPTPLNGFVHAEDQGPGGPKSLDQLLEQPLCGSQRRPLCPIEDSVVVLEMNCVTQAQHAQDGTDGALTRSQNSSQQEALGIRPDSCREQRRKGLQQAHQIRTLIK